MRPQDAEKDPYSYPWHVMQTQIDQIYEADRGLQEAELIVCTEPLVHQSWMKHGRKMAGWTRGKQMALGSRKGP